MCSYYRRFIPNFSQIAEPIIALARKYAHFKWSDNHQRAFEYLKDSLTAVPLLVYPDSNKPYVLFTDASDTCKGACLTQECDGDEKPLYYLSHKLSRPQCKWSVVEKEDLQFTLVFRSWIISCIMLSLLLEQITNR